MAVDIIDDQVGGKSSPSAKPSTAPSMPYLDSMAGQNNDVEAILKQLEDQLKQPEGDKPEGATPFQRFSAAMADALANAAKIYAGGSPGGNDTLAQQEAED